MNPIDSTISRLREQIAQRRAHLAEIESLENERKELGEELIAIMFRRGLLNLPTLITFVCEEYSVPESEVRGGRRLKHIVFARQVGMALARALTGHSLSTIGEAFGGRDHGTVLHACRAKGDVQKEVARLSERLLHPISEKPKE